MPNIMQKRPSNYRSADFFNIGLFRKIWIGSYVIEKALSEMGDAD